MPVDLECIYRFVRARRYGVLSTISPEGAPQAALVGIAVTPRLEMIFDTVSSSRKVRNLVADPQAAFVIGWENEITVQYEGEAGIPKGEDLERYRAVYFETWPDGRDRLSWPGLLHFVVRPRWVRYSDLNAGGDGIVEFRLPDIVTGNEEPVPQSDTEGVSPPSISQSITSGR